MRFPLRPVYVWSLGRLYEPASVCPFSVAAGRGIAFAQGLRMWPHSSALPRRSSYLPPMKYISLPKYP
jgi:hypothetical protein